jgi:outer membrane protein assembly factor BamB
MTTSREIVWEWRSWEHMEPEAYPMTLQDHRAEWTHGNTVAETAEGNILVSFRNISTVVMIERATGNIIWQLGSPPLAQQHDPRPLPNGNILIFDNGTHRRDRPETFSRVLEVDPRTSEIVWQYADPALFEFFSPYISGAQRLANGNTLICEGIFGRLFEVTHEGLIVWEYISPYFFEARGRPGLNNRVFRAFRYTPDEIEAARRA